MTSISMNRTISERLRFTPFGAVDVADVVKHELFDAARHASRDARETEVGEEISLAREASPQPQRSTAPQHSFPRQYDVRGSRGSHGSLGSRGSAGSRSSQR